MKELFESGCIYCGGLNSNCYCRGASASKEIAIFSLKEMQLLEALCWLDMCNSFDYRFIKKFFSKPDSDLVLCSEYNGDCVNCCCSPGLYIQQVGRIKRIDESEEEHF